MKNFTATRFIFSLYVHGFILTRDNVVRIIYIDEKRVLFIIILYHNLYYMPTCIETLTIQFDILRDGILWDHKIGNRFVKRKKCILNNNTGCNKCLIYPREPRMCTERNVL